MTPSPAMLTGGLGAVGVREGLARSAGRQFGLRDLVAGGVLEGWVADDELAHWGGADVDAIGGAR